MTQLVQIYIVYLGRVGWGAPGSERRWKVSHINLLLRRCGVCPQFMNLVTKMVYLRDNLNIRKHAENMNFENNTKLLTE